MPNPKQNCSFCSKEIFCSGLGDHILSNHEVEFFDSEIMRRKLSKDIYQERPIQVTLKDETYYLALCCNKLVSNARFAEKHYQNPDCKDKIALRLEQLAQTYPLLQTNSVSTENQAKSKEEVKYNSEDWIDVFRLANSARKLSYEIDLKYYKAYKRGIITKEQQEKIDELSDGSDEDIPKPTLLQNDKKISKVLEKYKISIPLPKN